ncbi:hypothetical protein HX744_17295 [Pseudonocardia sp. ICBG1122]|nr:hypothetical protein [Pseudonocardia pini]
MHDTVVSADELVRRTVRHADWVPCRAAFIDCRTPGSDRKDNYSFIGPGVTQNASQHVNLREPHGFNLGAAGMPHGTTNSLHLHFTAEVFINLDGDYQLRWGPDGTQGTYRSVDGDIVSVPPWIFRGFTNVGDDDGILLTVLGRDDTGGIIWGPTVLAEAAGHGLHLTADNRLIDTVAGDPLPEDVALIRPMDQAEIDRLDVYSAEQFRGRVVHAADRPWVAEPYLCSRLPGGGGELAPVIGWGTAESRAAAPRLLDPHGFALAWLRALPGDGVLTHRHDATQVLTVKAGHWAVTLNTGDDARTVELGPRDTLSVPPGAWRSMTALDADGGRTATPGTGELLVVTGGDGRVRHEWAPEVVAGARDRGRVLDADGYLAPAAVLAFAAGDD